MLSLDLLVKADKKVFALFCLIKHDVISNGTISFWNEIETSNFYLIYFFHYHQNEVSLDGVSIRNIVITSQKKVEV